MAAAIPKLSSSFVYEDLVSHVQSIRNQTIDMKRILDNRCKFEKHLFNELRSRSLTFIDPYGNHMKDNHLDHELINKMFTKCMKNYVPKYLQSWIKIGTMNDNIISSLNNFELNSAVSNYANDYQFIAYGQITIWIGSYKYSSPHRLIMNVLLTDNMDKIKTRIAQLGQFTDIQFKSFTINENTEPYEKKWNEGTTLKSEDTILSCQLYKNNCIIMGNLGREKKTDYHLFVKTLTKTTFLQADPSMIVNNIKDIIQNREGISVDSQRLRHYDQQLEDGRTLFDYNIQNGSMILVIERARGGMYHFTSGRQDFLYLTYDGAKAVKNVLKFKTKVFTRARHLSSINLQKYVLRGQNILSNLYRNIQNLYIDKNIPDLKKIILSTTADYDEDSDDISNDE